MNYNKRVEHYFFEPKHIGQLDCSRSNTVNCYLSDANKSNYFKLYLSCNEAKKIDKACFKACGSPYLIAALEWVCQQMEGSLIEEHPQLTYHVLVDQLDIPNHLYPIAILVEKGYNEIIYTMKERVREGRK